MNDRKHNGHTHNGSAISLWAYGYQLAPPVPRTRLGGMQSILDAGKAEARKRSEVWEGRFINGDDITDILVVSGTPAQDTDVNRRVEAELVRLEASYVVSPALEIEHDPRRSGRRHIPDGPAS